MSRSAAARVARIDRCIVRFDQSSAETDAQTGFVRVWGQIVPVGVLEYSSLDGAPFDGWTEFVPESAVFDEAANRTLLNAPITLQHPPDLLDASNTNRFQIGSIIELADDLEAMSLRARHLLTDGPSIEEVRSGRTMEISPGYTARVLDGEGEFEGQLFHATQSERRYNHVAVVTRARAGSDNALDRVDAVRMFARCLRADGLRIQVIRTGERKMKNRKDAELTIGEDTFNVPEAVADAFRALQSSNDEKDQAIAVSKAAASKDQFGEGGEEEDKGEDKGEDKARGDATLTLSAVQELIAKSREDTTSAVLAGLDKRDAAVRSEAKELAEVVTKAQSLLPQSYKCDGKSAIAIMSAAVTEAMPKLASDVKAAVKAKDSGRVRGLFDAACLIADKDEGKGETQNTEPKLDKAPPPGGTMAAAIEARRNRIDASRKGVAFKDGQPVSLKVAAGGKE